MKSLEQPWGWVLSLSSLYWVLRPRELVSGLAARKRPDWNPSHCKQHTPSAVTAAFSEKGRTLHMFGDCTLTETHVGSETMEIDTDCLLLLCPPRRSEIAQSCPTLCDPMDCSLQGSPVHGIFQARVPEWVAISFSRGFSPPRDRTRVSCIAGRHFTVCATREAPVPAQACCLPI